MYLFYFEHWVRGQYKVIEIEANSSKEAVSILSDTYKEGCFRLIKAIPKYVYIASLLPEGVIPPEPKLDETNRWELNI